MRITTNWGPFISVTHLIFCKATCTLASPSVVKAGVRSEGERVATCEGEGEGVETRAGEVAETRAGEVAEARAGEARAGEVC